MIAYAINRFGFMGEVETMKRLNKVIVDKGLIKSITKLQNIVMYLHAMAIH